jgi:hypothetical protein
MEKDPKFNFVKLEHKVPVTAPTTVDILDAGGMYLFVGKPGSGKTSTMELCLTTDHLLKGKYIHVLMMGPSPVSIMSDKNPNHAPYMNSDLDLLWLDETLKRINTKVEQKTPSMKKRVLVVMDDLLSELEESARDPILNRLINRRRHMYNAIEIDFIFMAQNYTGVPKRWRRCLTHILAWGLSEDDWKLVQKDTGFRLSQSQHAIAKLYMQKDPHNFVTLIIKSGLLFMKFEEKI